MISILRLLMRKMYCIWNRRALYKKMRYQLCVPIDGNPSRIKIVGKGDCLACIPKIDPSDSFGERISIDFGASVLMLNLEDFKNIARQVLNIAPTEYKDNIVQLRVVK